MSSDFSAFSQRHSISVVSHGISKADKLLDEEVASVDSGSPLSINSPRSHCAASPSPGPSSYLTPSESFNESFSFCAVSPSPAKTLNLNYVESHPDAFSFDQANPDLVQTARGSTSRAVEMYVVSEKLDHFLSNVAPPTPFLVMDLDIVEDNYRSLAAALPFARVFFAVKANPERAIVERLTGLGSCFDTASRNEIDQVLAAGNSADRISFGNTIKKQKDIQYAYSQGVRMFAFDSERELIKLAQAAPGSRVFCRILVDCVGAEWPLSKKFGCTPELAIELLVKAQSLGLDAYGVSFHPGSQQTNLDQWDLCLGEAGRVFRSCSEQGVQLRMVNIGGGFPARYRKAVAPLHAYAAAVSAGLEKHFPGQKPEVIIEPGRAMVGDAGVLQTEVVLVSRKGLPDQPDAEKRWVYLDAGKFNGLSETMDESIKYRIRTPNNDGPRGPVVLAGPTCDSADILYEKNTYMLPLDIDVGDKIEFLSAGAYSTSLSAVNFNGFDPLTCYCI